MQPSCGTGKAGTLAMREVRHGVVRVEDALAVVGARAEGRHAVRGGGPRESREAARGERVAEREVHVRPARAYGGKQGRSSRPGAAQAGDRPRLAQDQGSLVHDLAPEASRAASWPRSEPPWFPHRPAPAVVA